MSLFSSGQNAQIIMQGAQLINQSIQQRMQMEQQHAERMDNLELKREALDIKRQQLDSEKKLTEQEATFKQLQQRNLELQVKSKEGENVQDLFKAQQISISAEDPMQMNRQYQSIEELGKRRNTVHGNISQALSSNYYRKEMDTEIASMREELGSIDNSMRWRLEAGAKQYGWSHNEAAMPIKVKAIPTSSPEAVESQAAIQSVFAPYNPRQYPDFAKISADADVPGPAGNSQASLKALKTSIDYAVAGGEDEIKRFRINMINSMPGQSDAEKRKRAMELIKRAQESN